MLNMGAISRRRGGAAALAFDAAVLADDPVHYWRMSETSGAAIDDLGSGNIEATAAGNYTRNTASLIPSNSDPSITLDGASGTNIAAGEACRISGSPSVSWMFSYKFNGNAGAAANAVLISAGRASTSGYFIQVLNTDSSGFSIQVITCGPGNSITQSDYTNGAIGGTYILHVVLTAGVVSIYVNGNEIGYIARPTHASVTATSYGTLLGSYDGTSYNLNGLLDEVAFFNTALTAAQIRAHVAAKYTGINTFSGVVQSKAPFNYYKFAEASGANCWDEKQIRNWSTEGTVSRVAGLLPSESANPGALSLAGDGNLTQTTAERYYYDNSSYMFVCKSTDLAADNTLAHFGDFAQAAYWGTAFQITSAGKIKLQWNNGGFRSAETTGVYVLANTTVHIFLVFASATSVLVYTNGEYRETLTLVNACHVSGWTAKIGVLKGAGGATAYFKGVLDDWAFFRRAVSAIDIAAIYAAR